MGTDAYLTSNKFDGIDQAQTSNNLNPKDVTPNYREAPTPDKQQDTGARLQKDPITVDKGVINGQQGVSKKYRTSGTSQSGKIIDRLYKNKSEDQATTQSDNLESRLKK
ncbi:MAG: hypothetical protein ACOC33_00885 [bacterium]